MDAIVFRNVTKTYDTGDIGVENLSFTVKKGEFAFIIGRSGAGKSTVLKLISVQQQPSSGEISIFGRNLDSITKRELPFLHRQIGIMQTEFGLLDDRTLYANIDLAMKATEQPRRIARERVRRIMKTLGIEHRAQFYPHEVSMGEAARALLARAIVINPSILVADEPTANLDPDSAWDMMCILDELNRFGMTIVVASHNQELVSIMKKHVITLAAGRLVADEKCSVYNTLASDAIEERRVLHERAADSRK